MKRFFKMAVKASALLAGLSIGSAAHAADADPDCEKFSRSYGVMDFSKPVNRMAIGKERTPALKALKDRGVHTVIRYYDHPEETIACKTLLADEVDAILATKGMSVAVVFQHNNDDPETFLDGGRGTRDAKRALELAEANGQPYQSAIYFGVDGVDQALKDFAYEINKFRQGETLSEERKSALLKEGWRPAKVEKYANQYAAFRKYHARHFKDSKGNPLPPGKVEAKHIIPYVTEYIRQVKAVFDAASGGDPEKSYRIGAYGSGLVLDELNAEGLIDLKWLSMSRGFPGSREYRASDKWNLAQDVERACPWNYEDKPGIVGVDGDIVKGSEPDFGQWSAIRERTVVVARPRKCPVYLSPRRN